MEETQALLRKTLELALVLTSGQVLFPFEDSPQKNMMESFYIDEVPPQRAMVHRILHQTECLPSSGCAVGLEQARPSERGKPLLLSLSCSCTPCRHLQPQTALYHRSRHGLTCSCLPNHSLQDFVEQDVIAGHDAPHARLSRELITRARNVRALACDIQRVVLP